VKENKDEDDCVHAHRSAEPHRCTYPQGDAEEDRHNWDEDEKSESSRERTILDEERVERDEDQWNEKKGKIEKKSREDEGEEIVSRNGLLSCKLPSKQSYCEKAGKKTANNTNSSRELISEIVEERDLT
jgi:hypothetical protein